MPGIIMNNACCLISNHIRAYTLIINNVILFNVFEGSLKLT